MKLSYFPPVLSASLWLLSLSCLRLYDVKCPQPPSTIGIPELVRAVERDVRDIIARPELRPIVLAVCSVEVVIVGFGELSELLLSPQRSIKAKVIALAYLMRYVPLMLAAFFDPMNHHIVNSCCFAAAYLIDFTTSYLLAWGEVDRLEPGPIIFQAERVIFSSISGCFYILRAMISKGEELYPPDWLLLALWVLPAISRTRVLLLCSQHSYLLSADDPDRADVLGGN